MPLLRHFFGWRDWSIREQRLVLFSPLGEGKRSKDEDEGISEQTKPKKKKKKIVKRDNKGSGNKKGEGQDDDKDAVPETGDANVDAKNRIDQFYGTGGEEAVEESKLSAGERVRNSTIDWWNDDWKKTGKGLLRNAVSMTGLPIYGAQKGSINAELDKMAKERLDAASGEGKGVFSSAINALQKIANKNASYMRLYQFKIDAIDEAQRDLDKMIEKKREQLNDIQEILDICGKSNNLVATGMDSFTQQKDILDEIKTDTEEERNRTPAGEMFKKMEEIYTRMERSIDSATIGELEAYSGMSLAELVTDLLKGGNKYFNAVKRAKIDRGEKKMLDIIGREIYNQFGSAGRVLGIAGTVGGGVFLLATVPPVGLAVLGTAGIYYAYRRARDGGLDTRALKQGGAAAFLESKLSSEDLNPKGVNARLKLLDKQPRPRLRIVLGDKPENFIVRNVDGKNRMIVESMGPKKMRGEIEGTKLRMVSDGSTKETLELTLTDPDLSDASKLPNAARYDPQKVNLDAA